jgi:hypothetical protein
MSFVVEVIKKEEVLRIGEFDAQYKAVACAKRSIDAFLLKEYRTGMTADQLFERYTAASQYPCIFRNGESTLNVPFSHFKYAMARCDHVCGNAQQVDN